MDSGSWWIAYSSSTEQQWNNAVALKEYIERLVQEGTP